MVLVTGGTGMVGAHLLLSLVDSQKSIRAIFRYERSLEQTRALFHFHQKEEHFHQIDWVKCDLHNLPKLEKVFKGVTEVFHCAGYISFDDRNRKELLRTNMEGTANMVNLALGHSVQNFLYVSSIAVFGKGAEKTMITENSERNISTLDAYGLSKHLGEMEVWRGAQEGLKIQIVNPGVIIGAHFWGSGSGVLYPIASKGISWYLPGYTGVVSVKDVVRAIEVLSTSKESVGNYLLVGENFSFKELASLLAQSLGLSPPTKEVVGWLLELLWRLDWVKANVFGGSRKLTKSMVSNMKQPKIYKSDKVLQTEGFEYTDLKDYIKKCGTIFLERSY